MSHGADDGQNDIIWNGTENKPPHLREAARDFSETETETP